MKAGNLLAFAVAAATAASASSAASGERVRTGTAYFTAIKSTIGQGFTAEPAEVPIYEGDSGIDAVKRAAEAVVRESDYGAYIAGFKDADSGADIPKEIAAVCPEMSGRNTEGYLSYMDYTPESGWSFFLNGEYAQVGISGYEPKDGDVIEFRYTVYGYGSDLGQDNSGWGGAAALVPAVDASALIRSCAVSGSERSAALENALETLGRFGVSQSEIDAANAALVSERAADTPLGTESGESEANGGDTAPDTGAEGYAVLFGAAALACGALLAARKRR